MMLCDACLQTRENNDDDHFLQSFTENNYLILCACLQMLWLDDAPCLQMMKQTLRINFEAEICKYNCYCWPLLKIKCNFIETKNFCGDCHPNFRYNYCIICDKNKEARRTQKYLKAWKIFGLRKHILQWLTDAAECGKYAAHTYLRKIF